MKMENLRLFVPIIVANVAKQVEDWWHEKLIPTVRIIHKITNLYNKYKRSLQIPVDRRTDANYKLMAKDFVSHTVSTVYNISSCKCIGPNKCDPCTILDIEEYKCANALIDNRSLDAINNYVYKNIKK